MEKLCERPTSSLGFCFLRSNIPLRVVTRLVNHLHLPASALFSQTVVKEATSTFSDMNPGPELCMIAYRTGGSARLGRLEHLAGKHTATASL